MRPSLALLALGTALGTALALSGCRVFHEDVAPPDVPPIESADFGRMRNVSRTGDLWFGSTPCAEDLDLARRRGIRTVIDLSIPDEKTAYDVRAVCAEQDLRYVDVGLAREHFLDDVIVDLVLTQLTKEDAGPFLLFCGTGGRCAMFVAIHRAARMGVPLDAALEEARHAGMQGGDQADFVRQQVARLTDDPQADDAAAADVATDDAGTAPPSDG